MIEEHNPDVEFDWTGILKGQEAGGEPRPVPVPQQERRAKPRPQREFQPRTPPARPPAVAAAPPQQDEPEVSAPPAELEQAAPLSFEIFEDDTPRDSASAPSAAEARLGPEGLARLRARHAEVLARITEAIADPVRRDELKTQAERLNPDTWVTDSEVSAGLESYEVVFESLRGVVGRRRKRRRSRKPSGDQGSAPAAAEQSGDESIDPEFG